MSKNEPGTLLTLDPDARPARVTRGGLARGSTREAETTELEAARSGGVGPAEATLSLEPLRVPLAAMVRGTLSAEREVLERLGTEIHVELEQMREWRTREEAMRADQAALHVRAVEAWDIAGTRTAALNESMARLEGITQVLHAAVEAAIVRIWHRAVLAAWLVALTGLGLIGGLCGVVWLALSQH
jgi:hypothetical protein